MVAIGIRSTSIESVRQVLAHELLPAPPYVAAAFESGLAPFVVNVGHCACKFFSDPIGSEDIERLRTKYTRRGWSASRIERTLSERGRLGGLEFGLLQRVIAAAKNTPPLSLLVFWDDNRTTPSGPIVRVAADELTSTRHLVRAGTRIDITG